MFKASLSSWSFAVIFCVFITAYPAIATAVNADVNEESTTTDKTVSNLEQLGSLSEELKIKVQEFNMLSAELKKIPESEKEVITYRRDTIGFNLLEELSKLAKVAAELPEEDELRIAIVSLIRDKFSEVPELIFERSLELSQRIDEMSSKLQTASGSERFVLEAYLATLKDVRLRAYQASANLIEDRNALGMPVEELQKKLSQMLFINAETLVGRIQFASSAVERLSNQAQREPNNSELDTTLKGFKTMRRDNIRRLETVSDILEQLGQSASNYKAVLIHESGSLSVSDIESSVILDLVKDGWLSIRKYFAEKGPDLLFKTLLFIVVILVFRSLARLVKRAILAASSRSKVKVSTLMKDTVSSMAAGVVMLFGVLFALSLVGISLGPMLAGLGVAGFIVGFALQDTLGNFAAGGMILLYRPYDVDDFVEVAGVSGLVKKMSLVSTTINTFDNQTLVIPNSKIWGDVIKNVTAQKVRRVDMTFGIGYSDDIEHAEKVLREILSEHELVLKKPEPNIRLHELADSSVNFIVRPWVRTADYWEVYWDVTREVKMRFDKEGISIPFPQRDVHLFHENSPAAEKE